jgi:hypothetical protein
MENCFFGLTLAELWRLAFDLTERIKIFHNFNKARKMTGKDLLYILHKRHQKKKAFLKKSKVLQQKTKRNCILTELTSKNELAL